MVAEYKSDVYHLLPVCNVYIEIRSSCNQYIFILFFENLVHSEIKTTSILDFTCVCELYQIIQLCCIIDFLLFYLQGINSAYINFIYFD